MALKDWKKISEKEDVTRWEDKKSGTNIMIGKSDSFGFQQKGWYFTGWNVGEDDNRNFSSKSKALSFAKSYMRTH